MHYSSKRHCSRSRVWEGTVATITMASPYAHKKREALHIKGTVVNISASGMFLRTSDYVPFSVTADITINFDPGSDSTDFTLKATGKAVRREKNGVGFLFTSIDIARLMHCIIRKMNQTDAVPSLNSCQMAG